MNVLKNKVLNQKNAFYSLLRILLSVSVVLLFLFFGLGEGLVVNALRSVSGTNDEATPVSWLGGAENISDLSSDRSYALLAGKLINHGLVDASDCPGNGLLGNGNANSCGEIEALDAVILWQNQFDEQVYQSAKAYDVPPFLLKNILAVESQFWPARFYTEYGYEYGLGHMTLLGADTLLHWHKSSYKDICRSVYNAKFCDTPYTWLLPEEKAALQGTVLRSVSADCEHCPGGVNLTQSKTSIPIIAAALRANYENAVWMVDQNTATSITKISRSDLWRFAVANYNAGPGCVGTAIRAATKEKLGISWKSVSGKLEEGCDRAIEYVDRVSSIDLVDQTLLAAAGADDSEAAMLVLGDQYKTATPVPTIAEPTATPEYTETPAPTITPFGEPTQIVVVLPTEIGAEPSVTPEPTTEPTITEEPTATATLEEPTAMPTPFNPDPDPTEDVTPEPGIEYSVETAGVIVKFRSFTPEIVEDILVDLVDGDVTNQIEDMNIAVLDVPAENIESAIKDLNSNVFVEFAEPDYIGKMMGTPPTDGYYADGHQPNLTAMQVDTSTWDISTGSGIIVAVLDTGIDASHSELLGRLWVNDDAAGGGDNDGNGKTDDTNGWNFVSDNNTLGDVVGHGTHTAGVIAGNHDGSGIAGIAPGAKIMVLKVLNDEGYGRYSDVVAAINYAVAEGADVIQMGFSGEYNSSALLAATNSAYSAGVTVVAATGNTGTNAMHFPASNPHVIGVGALGVDNLSLAGFSTYGNGVDLVAPGVGVISSVPGGYGGWSGTSVSSAEVAGIAALLANQGVNFDSPDELAGALYNSATNLGSATSFGAGIPQARTALLIAGGFATPTAGPTSTATPMATPPGGLTLPLYEEFWAYNVNTDGGAIETQEQSWADNNLIESAIGSSVSKNAIGATFPDPSEGFDNQWATVSGQYASGGYWRVREFARTNGSTVSSIPALEKVVIKPRFYFGAIDVLNFKLWIDDEFQAQLSVDDGASWTTLATYSTSNQPPLDDTVNPLAFDVSNIVTTGDKLTKLQFRLISTGQGDNNNPEEFTINFDQVKVEATANQVPAISVVSPDGVSSFDKTDTITLTAMLYDPEEGEISSGGNVQWYSNIDGWLGSGLSLNVTNLTPGDHQIHATGQDSDLQTAESVPVDVTILGQIGPHGNYTASTTACALCHRVHSAQAPGELLNYPSSSMVNNDFCSTCHSQGGGATVVFTHSNLHFAGKAEDDFELLCVQCHDPHGNNSNLFAVRVYPFTGSLPNTLDTMTPVATPIVFTELIGNHSFDNTGDASSLCVTCHVGLTTTHPGGEDHTGGIDYTGQSCIKCHKHTYNTDVSGTPYPNGFMPATPMP